MLIQYRTFQDIVALIKPLILERTSKVKTNLIHFYDSKLYECMTKSERNKRLLKKKKPQFINILPKNGSGTSTDEELFSSPPKNNNRGNKPETKAP